MSTFHPPTWFLVWPALQVGTILLQVVHEDGDDFTLVQQYPDPDPSQEPTTFKKALTASGYKSLRDTIDTLQVRSVNGMLVASLWVGCNTASCRCCSITATSVRSWSTF